MYVDTHMHLHVSGQGLPYPEKAKQSIAIAILNLIDAWQKIEWKENVFH